MIWDERLKTKFIFFYKIWQFSWDYCTAVSNNLIYCGFIYFRGYQFSWIAENLRFRGYLISWFCQSLYAKPIENMVFVEYLNSWFTSSRETHANLYPTNKNDSTVCVLLFRILRYKMWHCYGFILRYKMWHCCGFILRYKMWHCCGFILRYKMWHCCGFI